MAKKATKIKKSMAYTLFGDLEGMTVADLREMLNSYPDHARVDAESEPVPGAFGSNSCDREFFRFVWEE